MTALAPRKFSGKLALRWSGAPYGPQHRVRRAPRARLLVETLEQRATPATFTVANTSDSGTGSFRQAIIDATAAPTDDTIVFDTAGVFATPQTITLLTGLPQLTAAGGALTITGTGAASLTIQRDPAASTSFRIFGSLAPTLTITGLTLSGGIGGALAARNETVLLDHVVFSGNTTAGGGGAMWLPQNDYLSLRNSTISGNSAGYGGGIYMVGGGLLIDNSTISGNTATGSWGGALYFTGTVSATPPAGFTPSTLVVRNSTISNNTAGGVGGGFTLPGFSGTLLVQNSTISGNSTSTTGGGIYMNGGFLTVQNSIVSGNSGVSAPDIKTSTVSAFFSAIGSTMGITTPTLDAASTALLGANLLLGPLQDNGGPTLTIAPMVGSPLLDAGSNALVPAGTTTDQRGLSRTFPSGGTVDIGSVEVQPATPQVTVDPAQNNPTNSVSSVVFDVTFDQPVTGFDPSQIAFTGSTAPGTLSTTITTVSASTYTVTVTGMTGDGTVVVAVKAGTGPFGLNGSGQNNIASPGSSTVTIDTDLPTVTINQDPAQNDPTNSPSIKFDVQFGEAVTGFTAAGVSLAGSSAGGTLVASVSPGIPPNSFVVTVTGMTSSGTVITSIPAGAAHDPVGNNSAASTSTDYTVTFDNVPPSVTIDQRASQGDPAGGSPVVFDVVFSEAVVGFDGTKVDLSASTAPGTLVATVIDTGPAYTVTVSGMTGGGTIVATIDPGVVTDLAGNLNLGSTSTDNSITYIHSGSVQFSAATYSINEQGTPTLTINATRTGGSDGTLSVNYATTSGTAVAGTDFTTASGTLNWTAGDTANKTFNVPILDDGTLETDKAFTVGMSGISLPGALGTPSTATVTILETAGLSFSAANYMVNESDGTATVTVKRLFDSSGAVTVHYATSDGSATQPSDYTTASGTLNWVDGDSNDKTFTVPLIDDILSEGNEKFNLTLSAATGNADLGPQSTATVTIGKSHGTTITGTDKKPQSTFTDADGDLVTVKLNGKVGTLTFYLTDGKGPISEIDLVGTDSSKSSVSITVKKPKGGTGDGRVAIGEIDGTGVKSLSLAGADLDGADGAGINLTSFLGSLTIGAIKNGADITLAGAPPATPKNLATKITAGVIGDGTDIAITGSPLGSLTATAIGVGSITAPSVGSITVKGKAKTKTTPAISGDFKSSLTIAGASVPAKMPALKSLKVAGTVGDVGSVSVGSFVNSELLAGYTGPITGAGTFNLPSTVGSFNVTGKTTAFSKSFVIASNFKNVSLTSVDPANGGTKFGFLYHTSMKALSVKSTKFKFNPAGPAEQDMPSSDFYVKRV